MTTSGCILWKDDEGHSFVTEQASDGFAEEMADDVKKVYEFIGRASGNRGCTEYVVWVWAMLTYIRYHESCIEGKPFQIDHVKITPNDYCITEGRILYLTPKQLDAWEKDAVERGEPRVIVDINEDETWVVKYLEYDDDDETWVVKYLESDDDDKPVWIEIKLTPQ